MAIAFQSTSISGASAAISGATAQSAVRDALVAHASGAWTLVEEFDSAGSTVHWVVLKNDGTLSATGVTFYVCIGRLASTGQICMMVGEVYTQATHTLGTFAPNSGNPTYNILADGSFAGSGGATSSYVLGTTIAPGGGNPLAPSFAAASTFRFIAIVEKDYAVINLNTTAYYLGALTDLIVPGPGLAAATPIGICDLFNGSAGTFGALTRHPIDATVAPLAVSYAHDLMPLINNQMPVIQRLALDTAIYLHPDRFQGGRVSAAEIAAIMFASATVGSANNSAAKVGALRAKFKNMRMATYPFAAVVYDQVVVDGRKHIILSDRGAISAEFVTPVNYSTTVKYGFVFDTGVVAP